MPTYLVRHVTTYRYASPVAFGEHRLMLRARPGHDQRANAERLEITPRPASIQWTEDAGGNLVGRARFGSVSSELTFAATLEVVQEAVDTQAIKSSEPVRTVPICYRADEVADLAPFIGRQHGDPEGAVATWVRAVLDEDPEREGAAFLARLSERIRRDFVYRRRLQQGIQEPIRTLAIGSGSCRDFAVLMAEAVRSLGFAARFVSGYLFEQPRADGRAEIGGHTHAWVQVYLPGAGWIDFDPTSGTTGNAGLIRIAAVRDPTQSSPISGSYFGAPDDFLELTVQVIVTRREEDGPVERYPAQAAA